MTRTKKNAEEKSTTKTKKSSMLSVEQTGSSIGCEKFQVQSLKALGLGKIGKKVSVEDNECIRGLIRKVLHIVKVGDLK